MPRPFTIVAAVCLGLAVAVVFCWGVSYRRIRGWRWSPEPSVTWLSNSGDGHLDLRRVRRRPLTDGQGHWAYVAPDAPAGVTLPGLAIHRTLVDRWRFAAGERLGGVPVPASRLSFDSTVWDVRVDYWLPTLALTVVPAAWGDRWRRRRRLAAARAAGRCVGCGYDLRSSPDRCPECGRGDPSPTPGQAGG